MAARVVTYLNRVMKISKHAIERMKQRLGYIMTSEMLDSTLKSSHKISQIDKPTVMYACMKSHCMFIVNEERSTIVSFWVCGTKRMRQYIHARK